MATLRGSDIVFTSASQKATINLPAGTTANDLCVVFAGCQGDGVVDVPPFGFRTWDDQLANNNASGAAFECNLTAAQIAIGSVSVGFNSPVNSILAIAVFVGALSGIRTLASLRASTNATSRTVTTDTTPASGDYALYFGYGRFNGTVASGGGSALQSSSNSLASGCLAGGSLGSSGAVSSTFTFSANSGGDYEIILVVAPTQKSGLQLRAPLIALESPSEGPATTAIRAPLIISEPLTEHSNTQLRDALFIVEPLTEHFRTLRMPLFCIESLHPVPEEGHVSTELFPGSLGSPISLPGLAFSFHKKPKFATLFHQAASGVSARQALRQYPIWEFELTYEFLRANVLAEFQTLLGFFLKRNGGFDTFLFKDPDDYLVQNGALGIADGATTQFSFKRTMGGFAEKVGQVDIAQTISIYGALAEAGTIPASGPYTITTAHAAAFVADLGVTKAGVPMVKVASAPAAGQYSVSAGVYTFNSADHGAAVSISYRYLIAPAAYAVTLPNLLIFGSAPANGTTISADFQFYFNLRFLEDTADFEKFADKFWSANQITLESVPQ